MTFQFLLHRENLLDSLLSSSTASHDLHSPHTTTNPFTAVMLALQLPPSHTHTHTCLLSAKKHVPRSGMKEKSPVSAVMTSSDTLNLREAKYCLHHLHPDLYRVGHFGTSCLDLKAKSKMQQLFV